MYGHDRSRSDATACIVPWRGFADMQSFQSLDLSASVSLVHGRHGYFLVNSNDRYVGRSLLHYGEFSPYEAQLFRQLLRPGWCVVEVGANIGAHTVLLAKLVGSDGRVFAFEPQAHCYAFLQAQIALNELTNVEAYNMGLSDQAGHLFLPEANYALEGNFGGISLLTEASSRTREVPVSTLDDSLGEQVVHFIKADVEGMEHQVLQGGANLINKHHPVLYVENDRIEKSRQLLQCLLDFDYRVWWSIGRLYEPNNFFYNATNFYGNQSSFNLLCFHRSSGKEVKGVHEVTSAEEPHPLQAKRKK